MSAKNLGSLTLDVIAKIGGFTSGMDAAGRAAEKNAKKSAEAWREAGDQFNSFVKIGTAGFAAFSAASTSAFAAIKAQADAIDVFNDVKDATGASIEGISALDRVARETGSSIETVESILVKFNATLKDAKPGDDADRLFKALNLNISELKSLDPAEALRRTAVAFSQFEDNGSKARAMQELFGKSVKEAAPFLADLAQKTELVGTTSTQTAAQAEAFNKQLFTMQANATDAARSIAGDLLPALNRALMNFNEIKKQGNLGLIVKDAAKDLVGLGKLTGDNSADIKNFMKERERLERSVSFATAKGLPVDDYKKDIAELNRYLDVVRAKQRNEIDSQFIGADFGDAVSRKFRPPSLPSFGKPDSAPKGARGGGGGVAKDPYAEAQRYIESLQKQLERTEELTVTEQVLRDLQLDRLGKVTAAQKDELLGVAGQIDAAKELAEQMKEEQKALEETKRLREQMMDEGKRLYEQMRTPLEQFNDSQDRLNTLLEAGAVDLVTAARAGEAYKKQLDEATKSVTQMDEFAKNSAENIQRSLGDTLVQAMDGNWKDIGKGFGDMLRRMAAEAVAADITRKLFGSSIAGGQGQGWVGQFLESIVGSFAGARALGGPVLPNSMYQINERGPEVFQAANGNQYLMTGNTSGRVLPNGGATVVNNINVSGYVDLRTAQQIAKDAGMASSRAMRRLS